MNAFDSISFKNSAGEHPCHHWLMARLSWSAILAGCVVALSIHLLLTIFCIGVGIRFVNPYTDENPLLGFTTAAGVAWTVSALISLWIGGWVAGRTSGRGYGNVGGLHGIVVWSVATVLSFTVLSGAVGLLAGGAVVAVGKVGAAAAKGAGNALPSLINEMDDNNSKATSATGTDELVPAGTKDTVASFLDEVAPATGSGMGVNIPRARREIGAALFTNFNSPNATNRAALIQALEDFGGKSPTEAEKTVKEWEASYQRVQVTLSQLKAEAKLAAEDAADKASKATTTIAAWTFLMFGVGAFSAGWGGRCGGQRALALHGPESERIPLEPIA
ncbi:MAG TPA: hypothetical protein VK737_09625 [Opitutales bacterium]|jgi:hypothetical protein|nr:hypothetical protein [Opitutales bacterium]